MAGHAATTRCQHRTFGLGDFHVAQVLLQLGLADHRADVGARSARITHLDFGHACLQCFDESGINFVGHDQTAGCRATLAGGVKAALHRQLNRLGQVGIIQHHLWVFATHLQLDFFAILRTGGCNATAHAHRAGEADGRNAWVLYQGLTNHAATAHHQVKDTGGNTTAMNDVSQRPSAAGYQIGRFQHHAIAKRQSGCNLPGRDGDGEVPRCNQTDHADGFARDFNADAGTHGRQGLTGQAQAFTRKELEDLPCAGHFTNTFSAGLAFLTRQQIAQLFFACQDFSANFVQCIGTCLNARCAPGREGRRGCSDGSFHVCSIALSILTDHVGQVAGIDVGSSGLACSPLAVDEVVMLLHSWNFLIESGVFHTEPCAST